MSVQGSLSPIQRAAACLAAVPVPLDALLVAMCDDLALQGASLVFGQGVDERTLASVGEVGGDAFLLELPTAARAVVNLSGARPSDHAFAPWSGILAGALARMANTGGDPTARMHAAGALMRAMAHDLRNLLGVFDQNIQFVQQGLEEVTVPLPDTIEEDLEQVQEATERVLSYVQRVPELAHILQGPWNPEPATNVFERGLQPIEGFGSTDVQKVVVVEAGLPAICLDVARVTLLAEVLAKNAEQAGARRVALTVSSDPGDNPLIREWSETLPAGPHIFFSCADDGQGMDVFVLSRCGEPLFSHPPGTDRPGLGFSLLTAVLGAVGGQVAVTSARKRGGLVVLAIPVAAHPGPGSSGEVVPLVPQSERIRVAVRLAPGNFREWALRTLVESQFVVVDDVSDAAVLIADREGAADYPGPPTSFFYVGSRLAPGMPRPDALMPERPDRSGLVRRLSMAVARRAR